jgi:serine/threonine-protein kinase
MARTSATPLSREELSFLQHRVARFGLGVGAMFGFAFRLVTSRGRELAQLSMLYHALGTACFLAIWLACRDASRSEGYIRAVEGAGLLLGGAMTQLMATAIPLVVRPEYILIMATSIAVLTRAIYVPSTATRTFALAGVLGVFIVGCVYAMYLDLPLELWRPLLVAYFGGDLTVDEIARGSAIGAAAWWVPPLALSTAASAVIYGLRKRVRDVKKLGQYQLEEKLGEGGMGVVYRASHAMLARPAAVKLLPPDKAGEASLRRFEREVMLTAKPHHPNTVTVFDYGRTPDGVFYYAMELIEGATLERIVEVGGPMPAARVIALLERAAAALVEAHGVGLIHRDLKPANIMLELLHPIGGEGAAVKVLDFGLVKDINAGGSVRLTMADAVQGTPLYLSPEAIGDPDSVGPASDIYALGAVGYFALTGRPVFEGRNVVEVCSHHLHTVPVSPSNRLGAPVPEDLERLILDCLAKLPGGRPGSALALQQRLRACADWGGWRPEDAQAWWQRYGEQLRPRATEPTSEPALTIDLGRLRTHRPGG